MKTILKILLILSFTLQLSLLKAQDSISLSINKFIDQKHYPGLSFSIYDFQENKSLNYTGGLSDVENGIKMTSEHKLLGGSTGKTFVAAIVMQLVEEGKLSLDDLASKYLAHEKWFDNLANHDSLTIRHLLQHQSGLTRYVFKSEFIKQVTSDPDKLWKPEELIQFVLGDKPLFEPGTSFAYSDTDYILIGMIIEKVTKMKYYDVLINRILEPLGLESMTPTDTRKIDNLAQGYIGEADPIGFHGLMLMQGVANYNLQFEWTGGGLAYRTQDYARWLAMLYEGKAFDMDKLRDQYFDVVPSPEIGGKYGIGFMNFDLPGVGQTYGHGGFFPGYYTLGFYIPEYKKAFAMQVNTTITESLKFFMNDYLALIKLNIKQ